MTKLTIESEEFTELMLQFKYLSFPDLQKLLKVRTSLVEHINAKIAEAYEQGKKDTTRIISAHKIPVPATSLGELAAQLTLSALREIKANIEALPKEPTK